MSLEDLINIFLLAIRVDVKNHYSSAIKASY
jgi:hypothetical protein